MVSTTFQCELLGNGKLYKLADVFDKSLLENKLGRNLAFDEAVLYYLKNCDKDNWFPSSVFDADYYCEVYSDVANSGIDPFSHFIQHGFYEGRVYSPSNTAELVKKLQSSEFIENLDESSMLFQPDICEQIIIGKLPIFKIIKGFDDQFVKDYYPIHYSKVQKPFEVFSNLGGYALPTNMSSIESDSELIFSSDFFDEVFYLKQLKELYNFSCDFDRRASVIHYCCEGIGLLLPTSVNFNTRLYLSTYKDIYLSGINPLSHYISYGAQEARVASNYSEVKLGYHNYDSSKKSVVVVSHEASRTGAPIVALNCVKELSKSYNVVTILGNGGPLLSEFVEFSIEVIQERLHPNSNMVTVSRISSIYSPDFWVCNSAETYPIAIEASIYGQSVISLIHEFSEYARPRGRMAAMALASDKIICPAEIIANSLYKDIDAVGIEKTSVDIIVRHQGVETKKESSFEYSRSSLLKKKLEEFKNSVGCKKIVVGCGYVSIRKGLHQFVEVAALLRKEHQDIAFVWVGANYNPEDDMAYSIYVHEQIQRSGLTEHIKVLPEQPDLEEIWNIADCLFMSSLLDPFPNVAIDALVRNIPVVCYDGATGIAELAKEMPHFVYTAPYTDPNAAAASILEACRVKVADFSHFEEMVAEKFSFPSYVKFIINQISTDEINYFEVSEEEIFKRVASIPPWYLSKIHADYLYSPSEKISYYKKLLNKLPAINFSEVFESELSDAFSLTDGPLPVIIIDYKGSDFSLDPLFDGIELLKASGYKYVYVSFDPILYSSSQLIDSQGNSYYLIENGSFSEQVENIRKHLVLDDNFFCKIIVDGRSMDWVVRRLPSLFKQKERGNFLKTSFGLEAYKFRKFGCSDSYTISAEILCS